MRLNIGFAMLSLSLLAFAEGAQAQKEARPLPPTNFGLVVPQPESELPKSQTPPQQAIPKDKRPVEVRLEKSGDATWRLADGWEMTDADRVVARGGSLFNPAYDTSEWYNAVVPGTVLTTLVEAGIYPDPYYGLNNLAIPESLCRQEWWYRICFDKPADAAGRRVWLNFEGINYRADVWLNGRKLGDIRGAFVEERFDVTECFADHNVLAVKIYPPYNPGIPHEQSKAAGRGPNGGQLCLDGPTFISSEGWDWIPGIRDRNIGIWQDVSVEYTGDVTLAYPQVVTDLPLPDTSSADVTIRAEVTNHATEARRVVLTGRIDGVVEFEYPVDLAAGESRTVSLSPGEIPALHLDHPQLWWPNGYGDQAMYDLDLRVSSDGVESDGEQVRFGVREFSYELTADTPQGEEIRFEFQPTNDVRDGEPLFNTFHRRVVQHEVVVPALREGVDVARLRRIEKDATSPYLVLRCNGVRIFCRGGNWGMDDGMKRVSRERLEPAFRLHREEGFNMVRNWTGESTEELFYTLCDEYGMLVWNDFWISTEGSNLNVNDEDLFLENAVQTVKRFRNHPSLAVWCPRNEGYATPTMAPRLERLIAREDGTRFYSPNSRYMNLRTSGPWHYIDEKEYFTRQAYGFTTELGSPSVPTAESMRKFIPESEQWPISDTWYYHDLHFGLPEYCQAVDKLYGKAESLDDFCRKVQLINYDSHRAMLEAWNSRMWNSTSGVLLWMSHPAWPSLEWQTYTWDFETHGSFYGCRKACEPLHVQANPHDGQVLVVNTTRSDYRRARVVVSRYTFAGKRLDRQSVNVAAIAANGVTPVMKLQPLEGDPDHLLRLELFVGGKRVSVNDYLRSTDRDFTALNEVAMPSLRARLIASHDEAGVRRVQVEVTNTTSTTALSVKFNIRRAANGEAILPAYISEGYIHLLPGERRIVEAEFSAEDDAFLSAEGYNFDRVELLSL